MILRDFTPDNELRYLSIADEALKNNHLFAFTNHGQVYADKPPLYLWIVMLGKSMLGTHNVFFLSFFSIIPAFIIIYIMDKWIGKHLSKTTRIAAAVMLMTSVFFLGGMIVLRMDMLMCMFITLALFTFYKMYEGAEGKHHQWLLGFYIFMSVFTKGPIGIIIPLLSIVAFLMVQKEIRTFSKYFGWRVLATLLICFSFWFLMVWIEGGNGYLNNLLFNQTVNRAVDSFKHKEPFYYYIVTIWYSIGPWSLLFITTIIMGIQKKYIITDLERFLLTVISVSFIFLSIISSKIPIYMLPAYPFIAYLAVLILSKIKWKKWIAISIATPVIIILLAVPVALFLGINYLNSVQVLWIYAITAAIVLIVSGLATLYHIYNKKNIIQASIFFAGGLLVTILIIGLATPFLNNRIGYGELCNKGKELSEGKDNPLYCTFKLRRAENIDVYLNTDVKEISLEDIVSSKYKGAILFTSEKKIKNNQILYDYLKTKKQEAVGNNLVIQL
ncbi:ArnT family glycosyltransferase [Flavobacterium luminosum]|uniref:Glycosyltransferase family 39 protein n=1 Tax=Flavobacterium luminosum TaxID=2949086 RepID=A0ABT0TPF0_9FLAO|nr:glycosyltransferase family 39 protein [Flavobacterium sp. HXWNR70]MCL9808949.1 glycosyltransferase family 39 protein [Flavobacterium sp. HXWNR70]